MFNTKQRMSWKCAITFFNLSDTQTLTQMLKHTHNASLVYICFSLAHTLTFQVIAAHELPLSILPKVATCESCSSVLSLPLSLSPSLSLSLSRTHTRTPQPNKSVFTFLPFLKRVRSTKNRSAVALDIYNWKHFFQQKIVETWNFRFEGITSTF